MQNPPQTDCLSVGVEVTCCLEKQNLHVYAVALRLCLSVLRLQPSWFVANCLTEHLNLQCLTMTFCRPVVLRKLCLRKGPCQEGQQSSSIPEAERALPWSLSLSSSLSVDSVVGVCRGLRIASLHPTSCQCLGDAAPVGVKGAH